MARIVTDSEPQPEERVAELVCADFEQLEKANQRHAPLRIREILGEQSGAAEDRVCVRAAFAQIIIQAVNDACEVDRRYRWKT
ncbi:MAG: hypothetical protein PVG24_04610 [Gammaproteobacteria bacterium]